MPITVNCPNCGGAMRVPDNLAGKKVKCPKCANIMALPTATEDAAAIQATAPAPAVPPPLAETSPPPRERPARDRRERDRDERGDERDDRYGRDRNDRDRDDDRYDDERYDDVARVRADRGGNNGMAIAGMVLGIVGFVVAFVPCIGWVLALIMGIVGATLSGIGLASANKLGSGKGMAIAGLVLSILAIIWVPIWFFIVLGTTVNAANQAAIQFEQAVKNDPQFQKGFPFQPNVAPQGPPTPATGKLTLNNGQASQQSNLAENDPRDRVRAQSACKVFTITMTAGKTYQIDMIRTVNENWDPYLRLEDPAGTQVAFNDDGAGNLNSRITFACPADGEYRIVATSLWGTGNFTLQVSEK